MKKTYTFLVTTNKKGKTKSFTIPASLLKLFGFIAAAVIILVFSILVDYVGLLLEAGENKRLKAENASLKRKFKVVESNIRSLENSLERVKNFSTKLRLITDVDGKDSSLDLAMGKKAKDGGDGTETFEDSLDSEGQNLDSSGDLLGERPHKRESGELLKMDFSNYSALSIRIQQGIKESQMQEQGVLDLYTRLSKHSTLLRATPTIKPTKGWYTAKFGYNNDPFSGKPVMNQGVEIAAPEGSPVVAPADGIVTNIGYDNNDGKVLMIDHGHGIKTVYAHNSQIFVEVGQRVKRNEMIASVGSTGRTQGSNLYYEVRFHGVPVDPLNYILE